jgi:hypothetical protein
MTQQLNNMLGDCRCDSSIKDLSEGGQTYDYFVHVAIGEILDDGGDEHDEEVAIAIEEERAHQVSDTLEDQIFILGQVYRVDVGEGRRVAQHLDVQCTDEMLLDLLGGKILLSQFRLQRVQFPLDDTVLFLLGLGLADVLDEFLEVLGEMGGCGRHADSDDLFMIMVNPIMLSTRCNAIERNEHHSSISLPLLLLLDGNGF